MQLHQQISIVNAFPLHACAECRHFRLAYDHALLSVGEGTKGGALVDLYGKGCQKQRHKWAIGALQNPLGLERFSTELGRKLEEL